jgi:hypothetical protein
VTRAGSHDEPVVTQGHGLFTPLPKNDGEQEVGFACPALPSQVTTLDKLYARRGLFAITLSYNKSYSPVGLQGFPCRVTGFRDFFLGFINDIKVFLCPHLF